MKLSEEVAHEALRALDGITIDPDTQPHLSAAWHELNLHIMDAVRERDAQKRAAEDAKVAEFRESSMTAIASVFKESNAQRKDWGSLSEDGRKGWRARYNAARKHFQEEA